MANYITVQQFADLNKVTRQAIYKLFKLGLLQKNSKGMIDAEHRLSIDYIEKRKNEGFRQSPQLGKKKPKRRPKKKEAVCQPAVNQATDEIKTSQSSDQLRIADRAELERLKLIEAIIKARYENEKNLGESISKDLVKKVIIDPINTAHMKILTDGTISLATALIPMIKGEADQDEVQKYLKKTIGGFIRSAKTEMKKINKKIKDANTAAADTEPAPVP